MWTDVKYNPQKIQVLEIRWSYFGFSFSVPKLLYFF